MRIVQSALLLEKTAEAVQRIDLASLGSSTPRRFSAAQVAAIAQRDATSSSVAW
jgi:hypothetical protein